MTERDSQQQSADEKAVDRPDDTTGRVTDEGAGKAKEIGGPKGPEPTRYGDWERNGRCSDF
ncbi:uncharacterized protein DUF1674 [Alkalispirillum mobile]|uniref:Uncharacterized protein DUF1674 n=1 Tax=Alkalispirillum mobile TaxID=85925 RepID=A0A498CD05_9GAMM|nr:succinate dehydrogenase assembly factor 4 [Alkalispirillum mobile]RLK50298.1 uncharacterized protein DUF1674 [Alkalispirillum mobile]